MRCFGLFYDMNTDYHPPDEEMMKKLGARIRTLRIRNGYNNYEKFAHAHDISRSQIWRYEKGLDIKFSTLLKVVKALNVTLAEFFSEGFD
jgi:transcriptional regulator with XRE-family HTH domain